MKEKQIIRSAFFNFKSCYTKKKDTYPKKIQKKLKKQFKKIERLLAYEKRTNNHI